MLALQEEFNSQWDSFFRQNLTSKHQIVVEMSNCKKQIVLHHQKAETIITFEFYHHRSSYIYVTLEENLPVLLL